MKVLLIVCAAFLFLSLTNLPIGFYTFLRILVTIGSITIMVTEFEGGINIWIILFGIIAILFNPLFPVYLHNKSTWMPLDILCGTLFLVKSFLIKQHKAIE